MKVSALKNHLNTLETLAFQLPNGTLVPEHFHVTEVGKVTKSFIDCGGNLRTEEVVNLQLWNANDYNHRLHPEKFMHIVELSQKTLGFGDLEIEVEFQGENTINKYNLDFNGTSFVLINKATACLAEEACGISEGTKKVKLSDLETQESCCSPSSGCC